MHSKNWSRWDFLNFLWRLLLILTQSLLKTSSKLSKWGLLVMILRGLFLITRAWARLWSCRLLLSRANISLANFSILRSVGTWWWQRCSIGRNTLLGETVWRVDWPFSGFGWLLSQTLVSQLGTPKSGIIWLFRVDCLFIGDWYALFSNFLHLFWNFWLLRMCDWPLFVYCFLYNLQSSVNSFLAKSLPLD